MLCDFLPQKLLIFRNRRIQICHPQILCQQPGIPGFHLIPGRIFRAKIGICKHPRKLVKRLAHRKLSAQTIHFADRLLNGKHLRLECIQLFMQIKWCCARLVKNRADIRQWKSCLAQLADDKKFLNICFWKIMVTVMFINNGRDHLLIDIIINRPPGQSCFFDYFLNSHRCTPFFLLSSHSPAFWLFLFFFTLFLSVFPLFSFWFYKSIHLVYTFVSYYILFSLKKPRNNSLFP